MNITYVTGNPNKAKYFADLIGQHIGHHAADVPEIQSLDLEEIVEFKARAAYAQLKTPVIIEDTGVVINSLGKLPGPFIKWFEMSMGLEKICRLADISEDRSAVAGAVFGFCDGGEVRLFRGELAGTISKEPRGDGGFGFNPIFIPVGTSQTLSEMDEATFKKFYVQFKPFAQLKEFLSSIDNN